MVIMYGLGQTILHYLCTDSNPSFDFYSSHYSYCNHSYHDQYREAMKHKKRDQKKVFLELLLKTGLDVNARDELGNTPLHTAVIFYNYELIELLIKHKADHTLVNNKNLSPLAQIMSTRREPHTSKDKMITFLINRIDLNAKNKQGLTTWDEALIHDPFFSFDAIHRLNPSGIHFVDSQGSTLLKKVLDMKLVEDPILAELYIRQLLKLGAIFGSPESLLPLDKFENPAQWRYITSVYRILEYLVLKKPINAEEEHFNKCIFFDFYFYIIGTNEVDQSIITQTIMHLRELIGIDELYDKIVLDTCRGSLRNFAQIIYAMLDSKPATRDSRQAKRLMQAINQNKEDDLLQTLQRTKVNVDYQRSQVPAMQYMPDKLKNDLGIEDTQQKKCCLIL